VGDKYMTVVRNYPRGNATYGPGRVLLLSAAAAAAMVDGQWGRPSTEEEIAQARGGGRAARVQAADVDATDGARALAEAAGLDLLPYAGKGTGKEGRIVKADVEQWTGRRGEVATAEPDAAESSE
jgi:pyruvate/2-oxoglutarate dehydrogenase complex dihydrolipoamide acyltransferase (E2) component